MIPILLCSFVLVPEVMGRQFFYQGCCQLLAYHQQKRDHDVVVALVVVQLRVALQDEEDDVDQFFLEPFSLFFWHAWGGEGRGDALEHGKQPSNTEVRKMVSSGLAEKVFNKRKLITTIWQHIKIHTLLILPDM